MISPVGLMLGEPLELEYVATAVEKFNHCVTVVDLILEKRPIEFFVRVHRPHIVYFSGHLAHSDVVTALAARVKAVDAAIITVVGGVPEEVRPKDFRDASLDHVGGEASLELLVALANDGAPPPASHRSRTCYPAYPSRRKTTRYRQRYHYLFHDRCATLKTVFRAASDCDFCSCQHVTDGHLSYRDLDDVMEEIDRIEEKNVVIVDDDFLADQARVELFCHLVRDRRVDKNFVVAGRADFIARHPETMALLKSVGVSAVCVGIEAGRQSDLAVPGKNITVDLNRRALAVLEANDILAYCRLLVRPDRGRQDVDRLIRQMRRFSCPVVGVEPLTAPPGTPLFDTFRSDLPAGPQPSEVWDLGHVLIRPTALSEREFDRQIRRSLLRLNLRLRVHAAALRRFGVRPWFRVVRGVLSLACQYREHDRGPHAVRCGRDATARRWANFITTATEDQRSSSRLG